MIRFLLLISCLFLTDCLHAQLTIVEPVRRKPNTTVNEMLIGYGRSRQRAEDDALQQASLKAYDGEFELKYITLGGSSNDYYCVIKVQHDVYQPDDRTKVQEMTVGYGRTRQLAETDARIKAEKRIEARMRSAKERRARQARADALREKRDSAAVTGTPGPILDKDDDFPYTLQSISFSGGTDDWLCYIKFEYLVTK